MGCTQSKIENEEAVTRCKERKQLMRDAVSSRNAFAAAHSAYTVSLKNTGAALSDYGQGEAPDPRPSAVPSSSDAPSVVAAVQPPLDNLPPPPPPLPDYSVSPLHRSASMPDLPIPNPKMKPPADAAIREEEDGDEDDLDNVIEDDSAAAVSGRADGGSSPPPPPPPDPQPQPTTSPPPPVMPESNGMEATWEYLFGSTGENMPGPSLNHPEESHPQMNEVKDRKFKKAAIPVEVDDPPVNPEKVVAEPPPAKQPVRKQKQGVSAHHQHAASSGGTSDSKKGKIVPAAARSVSLLQVLNELDEHFLKAYECGHDVSKMLEATRMHYHSNFADNRGHIDHSARVLQVITWNRSLKGIPNPDDGKDDFESDEWETHATVLDKMLAWEKKLYDEVKAGEHMKIDYQRKVALLNKQKKRRVNPEILEKTKSAVSQLHTRYIVDMQSMDSTVSEINHLRDDRLCPRLVELVDGMAKMWEAMYTHHRSQLKIVADLRAVDISVAPKETSEQHHEWTIQLWEVLKEWHSQFQKLMTHHKAYIRSLNGWLKLNLIPIESSLKEKVSSPPRVPTPPIQDLLHAWHDQLEKLPDELARGAIYSFSEAIRTIVNQQEDELKLKGKCEATRREYVRKARAFEDWYRKYSQKRAAAANEEAEPGSREGADHEDPVAERKFVVEAVKLRLESEVETHQKLSKQVREKSLGSLKTHLPELFRAMSEFALVCSEMYKKLNSISKLQNSEDK